MDAEQFRALMSGVTAIVANKPLAPSLADELNARVGRGTQTFRAIESACRRGVEEGWMCSREAGGIRYGRVVKPSAETHGFSVDVVRMRDIAGPHHAHPHGEIDLLLPLEPGARFDGHEAGWCVYPPGSAHHPTVTGGDALVLYLLPQGAIEFTHAS
jgi:hypothetical protein